MNKEQLYECMDGIGDELLARSEMDREDKKVPLSEAGIEKNKRLKQRIYWYAVMAATLCLAFTIFAMLYLVPFSDQKDNNVVEPGSIAFSPSESKQQDTQDSFHDADMQDGTDGKDAMDEMEILADDVFQWDICFNQVDTMLSLDYARYYYGEGYFTEELNQEELASILPQKRYEWMECSGYSGFSGKGELREITLQVTTSIQNVSLSVRMSEGEVPFNCGLFSGDAEISHVNGVDYEVYLYDSSEYGGNVYFEANCLQSDVGFLFEMCTPVEYLEQAKSDFSKVLECFTYYDAVNLENITYESIPEWIEADLTVEEAKADETFGAYFLKEIPNGFTTEGIHRQMGQSGNYLGGTWSKGYHYLSWNITYLDSESEKRITSVEDTVNYDLALYPIPRAESVPRELRQIVDNPIFRAEELSKEVVWRRAYQVDDAGDAPGWRMNFSVLYGDVVVTISSKGIDPEWVYEQLMAIISGE